MGHGHFLQNKLFELEGSGLDVETVVKIGISKPGEIKLRISEPAKNRIKKSRAVVDEIVRKNITAYGINTGFGSNAEKIIPKEEIELLQRYLIMSHALGVGEPFEPEIIRSAMLIRANTHAKGNSGIRLEVVEKLLEMLNRGVVPYVPKYGSLGASGDLAPLSHIALCLSRDPRDKNRRIEDTLAEKAGKGVAFTDQEYKMALKESGEAYLWFDSKWAKMTGIEAMAKAGIERIELKAKEGLALNNGCSVSAAVGCFATYYGELVQQTADFVAALSMEAMKGFESAFSALVNESRPYYGQKEVARRIREQIKGSGLTKHADELQNSRNMMNDFKKVQDSYSIRCIPQVHGPVLDAIRYVRSVMDIEINSATDNPLIFPESSYLNKSFSGGNFHGENISLAMDFISTAMGILGNISERRTFKIMENRLNGGLTDFLIDPLSGKPGLMSGAMIMQYTAASLASENKVLAHPASIDSIPTSASREDFVSMAQVSARKAYKILENVENILAIEFWCTIVALRIRQRESAKLSLKASKAIKLMSEIIPEFLEDRVAYDELIEIGALIHSGRLLEI